MFLSQAKQNFKNTFQGSIFIFKTKLRANISLNFKGYIFLGKIWLESIVTNGTGCVYANPAYRSYIVSKHCSHVVNSPDENNNLKKFRLTRITQPDCYVRFSPPYPPGSITMKNASETWRVNTPIPIHILYSYWLSKGMMPYNFRNTHPILIKRVQN